MSAYDNVTDDFLSWLLDRLEQGVALIENYQYLTGLAQVQFAVKELREKGVRSMVEQIPDEERRHGGPVSADNPT